MRCSAARKAILTTIVLLASTAVLCASFAEADASGPDVTVIVPSDDLTPEDPIGFILGYEAVSAEMRMSDGIVFILSDPKFAMDDLYLVVRDAIGSERFIEESELRSFIGGPASVNVSEQDDDFEGMHIDTEFLLTVTVTMDADPRWDDIPDRIRGFADSQNAFLSKLAASAFFQESRATDACVDRKQSDDGDGDDPFQYEDPIVESDCDPPVVVPEPCSQHVFGFFEVGSPAPMPVVARGTVF